MKFWLVCLAVAMPFPAAVAVSAPEKFESLKPLPPGEMPPGWLPIDRLDDKPEWKTYRKTIERPMIYLPPDTKKEWIMSDDVFC